MAIHKEGSVADASMTITPAPESGVHLSRIFLAFMALTLAVTGCTAMSDDSTSDNDPFRDQQSTSDATLQLGRWITPGMTISDAMKKLESRGFACQLTLPQAEDLTSSALCAYQTPPPPPTEQRIASLQTPVNWIVTLDSKDGIAVSNFQLSRSPSRIGE